MNRNSAVCCLTVIFLFLISAPCFGALLFDYGPTAGANGGCWVNMQSNQNFAEKFRFTSSTTVERIDIFTCIDNPGTSVHIKILSDASETPGAYLYQEDQLPSSYTLESEGIFRVSCNLTTPFLAQANTTYWIGVAGNESDINQLSVLTPGDGTMAQFNGSTFQFMTGVGDMMFQLYGVENTSPAVPIPTLSEWGMIIMSLILAGSAIWMMRRRQVS